MDSLSQYNILKTRTFKGGGYKGLARFFGHCPSDFLGIPDNIYFVGYNLRR